MAQPEGSNHGAKFLNENHQTGDELFAMPNRPPSHTSQDPFDPAEPHLSRGESTVWHPTPHEPGLFVTREWHGEPRRDTTTLLYCDQARDIAFLNDSGLQSLFEACGIHVKRYVTPADPPCTVTEIRYPDPITFCNQANSALQNLAPEGVRPLQFQPFTDPQGKGDVFTVREVVETMADRIVLISANLKNDGVYGDLTFHDLLTHAVAYLGMPQEIIDHLAVKAQSLLQTPQARRNRRSTAGMIALVQDLDLTITYDQLAATLAGDFYAKRNIASLADATTDVEFDRIIQQIQAHIQRVGASAVAKASPPDSALPEHIARAAEEGASIASIRQGLAIAHEVLAEVRAQATDCIQHIQSTRSTFETITQGTADETPLEVLQALARALGALENTTNLLARGAEHHQTYEAGL